MPTEETAETVERRTERVKSTDEPADELDSATEPAPPVEDAEAIEVSGDEPPADVGRGE